MITKKYTSKKTGNQVMEKFISKHVPFKTQLKIHECATNLQLLVDKDLVKNKVNWANFCGNRFCPMCAYIQSKKDSLKIDVLMNYIGEQHGKDFIMLSLTAPNVKGYMLNQEIAKFNLEFKNMTKRDVVANMNHGYIRKLEITYNSEPVITYDMWHGTEHSKPMAEYFGRMGLYIGDPNPNYDTYHVHFHVMFAVDGYYFKNRKYIKHAKWLALWRDVMQDESITQVDVRRVKRTGKETSEIAKYVAKDSDYTYSQEVFDVFYKALKGRQVITYSGLFAEANKKYKAKELDEYCFVDETEYVYLMLYNWVRNDYIEQSRRELTEEEKYRL